MGENSAPISYTLHAYCTRYSGWGARVQILLDHFEIPFTVRYYNYTIHSLAAPADLGATLPVLDVTPAPGSQNLVETLRIGDSLSICEFLAEQHPSKPLWPRDPQLRAFARSATAQVHSSFSALSKAYSANFIARYTGTGVPRDEAAMKDVRKLAELWSSLRATTKRRLAQLGEEDEGFLCGSFGIVDAFFWPMLWCLRTYNIPLTGISPDGLEWLRTMWSHPTIKAQAKEYFRQARDPQTLMAAYDDVYKGHANVTYDNSPEGWVFDG
ncbi:putative glutathione S transferase [Xylaria sp. CBS 124048]|nr:putative glutathione S transferase [Xylaria sp. CBS 124048]